MASMVGYISADNALRLARYFGVSVEYWTGIQPHYEVKKAKMAMGNRLHEKVKMLSTA
jgi:plasmid maintenance system antidote protein VapI